MKTTLMIAAVLAAGAPAVHAQDPPAQPPAATVPVATASVPSPASLGAQSPERLNEVHMLENILVNAMNQGASDLVREMQRIDPGSVITGSVIVSPARARGIALEGYGVLFEVDVPLMNMSVVWTQRQMAVLNVRDRISEARRQLAHATAPDERQQLEARIQLLTNQLYLMAPSPVSSPASSQATPVANVTQPAAGSVVAATTDVAPVGPLETRSTDEMYSDAIKTALMTAMVNHSSALMLGDDEWLTVAARDNSGTLPGAIDDRSGIILRIKGSDLAAFRASKLNRDEVLKKIEIREWR
jgi:hypothetical protein